MTLVSLNEVLIECCASPQWVATFSRFIPFCDWDECLNQAKKIWFELDESEWLLAFAGHPEIGKQKSIKEEFDFSQSEQSGMALATSQEKKEFEQLNRSYREKFGFIFLIDASKKSASTMLSALRTRLSNPLSAELNVASEEQFAIMKNRLQLIIHNYPDILK